MVSALQMLLEELRVGLPGDDTDDPNLRARDARAERVYARETAGASSEEAAAISEEAAAIATEIATEARESDEAQGKNPAETPITAG